MVTYCIYSIWCTDVCKRIFGKKFWEGIMKMKKQFIYIVASVWVLLNYHNGYCKDFSYDSDEAHEIVRQWCNKSWSRIYAQLKQENMGEYKRIVDVETNRCECQMYAAYHIFGSKFMDDVLNRGYSQISALEKAGVDDFNKHRTTSNIQKYKELELKCRNKYTL